MGRLNLCTGLHVGQDPRNLCAALRTPRQTRVRSLRGRPGTLAVHAGAPVDASDICISSCNVNEQMKAALRAEDEWILGFGMHDWGGANVLVGRTRYCTKREL